MDNPDARSLLSVETGHDLAIARLRRALLFHAIEGMALDFRDNLSSLVLEYHVATRLGLDVEQLFDEIARLAPPNAARHISGFPRRSPRDRSLEAFGYREVPTSAGVRYETVPP